MAAANGKSSNTTETHIGKSMREVTVLFTDIEDSTRFWSNRGDVKGRLMVDRHNRILFPVIGHFHGKVVKTIGDSIMARFDRANDAVDAAIAMQQAMEAARAEDSSFRIRIRIGVHTGEAIVENSDVFGDVVNVAARVESQSDGNQILLSGKCVKAIDRTGYYLDREEGFVPKGKRSKMALYSCDWGEHDDLVKHISKRNLIPLASYQKREVGVYALITIGVFYLLYLRYLRFILSDNKQLALIFLNPQQQMATHPVIASVIGLLLFSAIVALLRIRALPEFVFKSLKGIAVGGVVYAAVFVVAGFIPTKSFSGFLSGRLHQSHHLFVQVLTDNAAIRDTPSLDGKVIDHASKDTLLLQANVKKTDTVWNEVLIGKDRYGWIPRIIPPSMGVAEERVTIADKSYFLYSDLIALLIGLVGAGWGYISFRVKPV